MSVFNVELPKGGLVVGDEFPWRIGMRWHSVVVQQRAYGAALVPRAAFPLGEGWQEAVGQDGTHQHVGLVGKFSLKLAVFSCCEPLADTAAAVTRGPAACRCGHPAVQDVVKLPDRRGRRAAW